MKAVGVILVLALLITPPEQRPTCWCPRLHQVMLLGAGIGVFS